MQFKAKTSQSSSEDSASDSSAYFDGEEDNQFWDMVATMSDESLATPSKSKSPPNTMAISRSPTPVSKLKKKRPPIQMPPRINSPPVQISSSSTPASACNAHGHRDSLSPPRPLTPRHKFSEYSTERYNSPARKAVMSNKIREAFQQQPSSTVSRSIPTRQVAMSPPTKEYIVPDSDSDDETDPFTDTDSSIQTRSNSLFTVPSTSTSLSSIGSSIKSLDPSRTLRLPSSNGRPQFCNDMTASPRKQTTPIYKNAVFNLSLPSPALKTHPFISKSGVQTTAVTSPDSETLRKFTELNIGVDLDVCFIAHDSEIQRIFDAKQVEWGTQYELARGVTQGAWTWDEVKVQITKLNGTNEQSASRVSNVMRKGTAPVMFNIAIWKELDREQKAILENRGRGLGLMGAWEGDNDWHGGQIQQIAHLAKSKDGKSFEVRLEPMEKQRSHRFARFCGSRRILQLGIPDKIVMNENAQVKEFLKRKFILLGRIFVPFHSKEGSVYMVETNENWERKPQSWCGDQHRLSFAEFMTWHNPLLHNVNQAMSKFVTRYAIGLSNSIPAVEFEVQNIFVIDDFYADDWPRGKAKAPAEKIMTDGCGLINLAGLKSITKKMGYEFVPSAIQGRFDGSKGLWLRHPSDDDSSPRIWVRKSQIKITSPERDRAHRIFELLGPSRPSSSTTLSQQSILNLHHNGISASILIGLFEQGLVDLVTPLLNWTQMVILWNAINRAGGVPGSRAQRIAAGASQALGFQRSKWGHDDVDSGDSDDDEISFSTPTYTGRNQYSGAPLGLHESLIELIQAGFKPTESKLVQDKLKQVVHSAIQNSIEKYKIPLKESFTAWVVPDPFAVDPMGHIPKSAIVDPFGVLEEGQIYYRSSQPLKDPHTGLPYDIIEGEVIVGRYPIYLPSDLQKVTAVDIPQLSGWKDVIIVSVKGNRSLASLLSGGDMDGDYLELYREPEIVNNFKNQPFTAPPNDLMEANFERDVESVSSFCSRLLSLPVPEAQRAYQEMLLLDIHESPKGLYSMFHNNATAKLGYGHPETIRLAYIFNTLLDSSKTGNRLKDGIFKQDQKRYGQKPGAFGVLAELQRAGRAKGDALLKQSALTAEKDIKMDQDLILPYNLTASQAIEAFDRNRTIGLCFQDELIRIRKHVDEARDLFLAAISKSKKSQSETQAQDPGQRKKKWRSNKADQHDLMLKASQKYAEPIPDIVLTRDIDSVKASYACRCTNSLHFAFAMAFQDLCLIKAKASGIAPVTREFDECKTISAPSLRALSRSLDDVEF